MNDKEFKAKATKDLEDHYSKVIRGMINWSLNQQSQELEVVLSSFGINKKEIFFKVLEKEMKKWEMQ